MRLVALAACAVAVAGCAANPDDIAAADIGPNPYTGFGCSQLRTEQTRLEQEIANLSADQRQARTGDTIGVILIGVPVSTLSGNDNETDIAVARGRLQAVEQQQTARRCS